MNTPTSKDTSLSDLQRLVDIGRLSASLLHEIGNPLSAALIRLDDVKHKHACIQPLKKEINRLNRYLEAARAQLYQESQKDSFSLNNQLMQVRRITGPLAKQSSVKVIYQPLPKVRLPGDSIKFQQVLVNLILNAIEAYDQVHQGQPKTVLVRAHLSSTWLTIRVTDWGQRPSP